MLKRTQTMVSERKAANQTIRDIIAVAVVATAAVLPVRVKKTFKHPSNYNNVVSFT